MFCPRCGHEMDGAPRRCSSCGLPLDPVRRLLRTPPPGGGPPRSGLGAALGQGGLVALVVVLLILWVVFFSVGAVSGEAFLPFLIVLTWLAAVILVVHIGFAWWRDRRVVRERVWPE